MNKPFSRFSKIAFLSLAIFISSCMRGPSRKPSSEGASSSRQVWWATSSKQTWAFNYDEKRPIRTADWVDYIQQPFNPSAPNPFASLDPSVTALDYGLFDPALGGGHIAAAAQHALTYGNYMVGRQCLEKAVMSYMSANGITDSPDKFIYKQGFWPMRSSGIVATDSQQTKVSKALKSLHGGDLVYSRLNSDGPENGAEVVTLNCTTCHESRALIPTCAAPGCATSTNYKAVRQPWGTEGYITKNLKLMGKAVQDAVSLAASGDDCASGAEKPLMAALYEIQKAKHESQNEYGETQTVDMDPRRYLALTPDSSFYNPSGALAHSVLNLLVNEDSWQNKKPADVDQAYQMFRPEDVLFNNQFFPILNANYNQFFGVNRNGTPGPVNFSLNAAWSQKFYSPTTNMFHGMGCSYTNDDGTRIFINCDVTEKAIALAATTNSQGENPDLSEDTQMRFPGVPADYKWPLRKYSGDDGVFNRTRRLFIGLDSNTGNPAIPDITNRRNMTYESVNNGIKAFNARCAECHGGASMSYDYGNPEPYQIRLSPGETDFSKFITTLRDMPARAYIANLRNQPYVQEDAPRDLVMKQYEGYRGLLSYGKLPDAKKLSTKNLVGIALEQRHGCYLNMYDFLNRTAAPKGIQVTTPVFDVMNLGFVKSVQYGHNATNENLVAANYPKHNIFWAKEHPECGPLDANGNMQPTQMYDAPFHGERLRGTTAFPKLTATQIKEMIDFFVAISFDKTTVPSTTYGRPVVLRLAAPQRYINSSTSNTQHALMTPMGTLDGECLPTCAKFNTECDYITENSRTQGTRRTCCGDIDDSLGHWSRTFLFCAPGPSGTAYEPGRWIFCNQDSDCTIGTHTEIQCISGRCVTPESSSLYNGNGGSAGSNYTAPTPTPEPEDGNGSGAMSYSYFCNGYCWINGSQTRGKDFTYTTTVDRGDGFVLEGSEIANSPEVQMCLAYGGRVSANCYKQ